MVDVRFTSWAGYQLAPCAGEVVEVQPSVPICDPEMVGTEVGSRFIKVAEPSILVSADDLKPSMKAEDV